MYRTLRLVGVPYALPPGTPKDRVMILQDAMRKAFKKFPISPRIQKAYGEDPDPLVPRDGESDQGNAA